MPELFLTPAEMAELTGYRQPAKQAQTLRQRGIPFFLNARGRPKVPRSLIEHGGKIPKKPKSEQSAWQPAAVCKE